MTARELIKHLETCDIDKDVAIIVSILSENEEEYGVLLKEIRYIREEDTVIGLQ